MKPHFEHEHQVKIDALVADITAARAEFLADVDDLKSQLTPASIGKRGLMAVAGIFTDEFGGIKPKLAAVTAGVLASVVGLKFITRRKK